MVVKKNVVEKEIHNHKHHKVHKQEHEKHKVVKKLPIEKNKLINEKEIAMDFAEKVHKKFDRMIKASILFGSQATNTAKAGSDIDIILVIDDSSINWDMELIAWYREELGKLITAQNYPRELHINTIKLTTWWQDLIQGDPVVINILRYGDALIDSGGFFNPLKSLLMQGKMKSTAEAVYLALQRAPSHLSRSKLSILNSIEGVYWTMIDSAQAALITAGKLPPSPEQIPQLMKISFVDNGLLKVDYIRDLREIYILHKGIMHGEIHEVKGHEIDKWQEKAQAFLMEITKLIDKLLESRK